MKSFSGLLPGHATNPRLKTQQRSEWLHLAVVAGTHQTFYRLIASAVALAISAQYVRVGLTIADGGFRGSWPHSELFISYSGGFVRRGFVGSVLTVLFRQSEASPDLTIAVTFTATSVFITTGFCYLIFKRSSSILLFLLVVLSPATLMFSIYDPLALLRKESFLMAVLVLHALLACHLRFTSYTRPRRLYLLALFLVISPLFTINVLIYGVSIVFVGYHAVITLYLLTRGSTPTAYCAQKKSSFWWLIVLAYAPSFAVFSFSVISPGSPARSRQNFESIASWSGANSAAIDSHGWTLQQSLNTAVTIWSNPPSISLYVLAFFLAPVLLGVLFVQNCRTPDWRFAIAATMPTLSLFVIGVDWGRWISMITLALLICLAVLSDGDSQSDEARLTLPLEPSLNWSSFIGATLVLLYVTIWRLPHCCEISPLQFFPWLSRFF